MSEKTVRKPENTCRILFSGKLCFRSQIANHQKYLPTFYSPKNMFRNFIPVNPKFNQFGKWEPVQTLQRFDKISPFQKNMTVYSRKAVRKWNILTTSKSQNWLQEFQKYHEKIKLKQRAFKWYKRLKNTSKLTKNFSKQPFSFVISSARARLPSLTASDAL